MGRLGFQPRHCLSCKACFVFKLFDLKVSVFLKLFWFLLMKFDFEFVFVCSLNLFDHPTLLPCDHIFCKSVAFFVPSIELCCF